MTLSDHLFKILILLTTATLFSCENSGQLVDPFGPAQIELMIDFPESTSKSAKESGLGWPDEFSTRFNYLKHYLYNSEQLLKAIDKVVVVVKDSTTRELVLVQDLEIVTTEQGRVAEGILSIPVNAPEQTFTIIIVATNPQEEKIFGGIRNITLRPGEVKQEPVVIILKEPINIAQEGTVQASSIFAPGFEPELAIDGDGRTSWFSAGVAVDGDTSTFTWRGRQDDFFFLIFIINNSFHSDERLRTGFGFERITFRILDVFDTVVFDETVDYPKTGESPAAVVAPMVTGRTIRPLFIGHEDPTRGGFSELSIYAIRGF